MSQPERNRIGLFGRPNVGKSTLFNVLTRSRKALVKNEPGVTRDLLIEPTEWWGRQFDVVDTGGVTESKEGFSPLIREKVLSALNSFAALIVVFDAKAGLVPEDREIIRLAKESNRPFLVVVNKVDQWTDIEQRTAEFYEFGFDIVAASFERQSGIDQIVEWILAHLKDVSPEPRQGLRLTIVGKPNVGKSSLCNHLVGESRLLVSDQAGTTVDAVEVDLQYHDRSYILVDTAGLRRSSRRHDGVEFISAHMSEAAIRRADVVLVLVDSQEGPSQQDVKMVESCLDAHKAVIVVATKMDVHSHAAEVKKRFREHIERLFRFFPDIPYVFISAKTGRGIDDLFDRIDQLAERLKKKIPTPKLNRFFYDVIRKAPAPVWGTVNVKFYYLVQTEQTPPSFITFANHPQGVTPAYRRFLAKQLKDEFELQGIPLRIFVMASGRTL